MQAASSAAVFNRLFGSFLALRQAFLRWSSSFLELTLAMSIWGPFILIGFMFHFFETLDALLLAIASLISGNCRDCLDLLLTHTFLKGSSKERYAAITYNGNLGHLDKFTLYHDFF